METTAALGKVSTTSREALAQQRRVEDYPGHPEEKQRQLHATNTTINVDTAANGTICEGTDFATTRH